MVDPYESPRMDPLETEASEPSPAEAPVVEEHTATPVLGENISPLALRMFGVAACYVVYTNRLRLLTVPTHATATIDWILAMIGSCLGAAGLAAIALAIWRRRQGERTFPTQYGHWLLILVGAGWIQKHFSDTLYWYSMRGGLANFADEHGRTELAGDPLFHLGVILGIGLLLFLFLKVAAIYYSRNDRLWQRYGIIDLVNGLWLVSAYLLFPGERHLEIAIVSAALIVLMAFCYGVAILRDLLKPRGRDQLHWIGVSIPLFAVLTRVLERSFPLFN